MTQLLLLRKSHHRRKAVNVSPNISKVYLKTQGEIESLICEKISRFQQDYIGRGPKQIRAHMIGDLVVVRLVLALTAPELQLASSLRDEKGKGLLKQVRTLLIESARPFMEEMIREVTGVKLVSVHHDISTVTGEEFFLFSLGESPRCKEPTSR